MLNIPKIKTIDLELDDEIAPKTDLLFLNVYHLRCENKLLGRNDPMGSTADLVI